ncbi:MAG: glycosyltransferase family 2 protein [Candidatus Goldbacteria bacterium]|nr:glycosyltransferase family 2 protein [Candidatus Goldiibacteriota bacterium]
MKKERLPFISIITPTYNSAKVIGLCLHAIAEQDYPKNRLEVVIADAGSSDDTLKVVRTFSKKLRINICKNPLQTGEAGKAVGVDQSKGDILALIDSDNIITGKDFISRMAAPFVEDPDITGTEPLYFVYRKADTGLTKYFAAAGINDPLCLFIGNYDRYSYITGKWTGMDLKTEEKPDYIKIHLETGKMPTIGANGTFIRKADIKKIKYKPYLFDIDAIYEMVLKGRDKFVKVKTGIVHIYSPTMASFIKKQQRRISDFMFFNNTKQRSYPWKSFPAKGIVLFSLSCVTVIPLIIQAFFGFVRKPAAFWMFHPLVCEVTFVIYVYYFIMAKVFKKTKMKDRKNW